MIQLLIHGRKQLPYKHHLSVLLLGRFLSSFATSLFDITLLWLTIYAAQKVEHLAFVLILRLLPFILFGLAGGWLGDNLDRRTVIIFGDIGRAVTILGSIFALAIGADIIPVLAVSGFVLTATRSISSPAVRAIVPGLCRPDALHRANAALEIIGYAIVVITPALGGVALGRLSHITVLAITGSLFLAAAMVSATLPRNRRDGKMFRPPVRDYGLLLTFIAKRRIGFLVFMALNMIAVVAVSGAETLMIPAQTNVLFPQNPVFLGTILSVMAVSAIGGALTAGLMWTLPQHATIYVTWIVYALSLASFAEITSKVAMIAASAALGYSGAIIDTLFTVMVQRTVAGRHRAKLFGVVSIVLHMGDVTSLWLTALIASAFGFAATFQIATVATIIVAVAGLFLVKSGGRSRNAP